MVDKEKQLSEDGAIQFSPRVPEIVSSTLDVFLHYYDICIGRAAIVVVSFEPLVWGVNGLAVGGVDDDDSAAQLAALSFQMDHTVPPLAIHLRSAIETQCLRSRMYVKSCMEWLTSTS